MIDWNIWHEPYMRVLRRFNYGQAYEFERAAGGFKTPVELRQLVETVLTGAISALDGNAGESTWQSGDFYAVAQYELGVARLEVRYVPLTVSSAQKDEKDEGGAE